MNLKFFIPSILCGLLISPLMTLGGEPNSAVEAAQVENSQLLAPRETSAPVVTAGSAHKDSKEGKTDLSNRLIPESSTSALIGAFGLAILLFRGRRKSSQRNA